MPTSGIRRRPPWTLQDFIVVILEALRILAVHGHGRNAEPEGFRGRLQDTAAPVVRPVDLPVGGPAFRDTDLDQARQLSIQITVFAVLLIEPLLHIRAGGHILDLLKKRNAALDEFFLPDLPWSSSIPVFERIRSVIECDTRHLVELRPGNFVENRNLFLPRTIRCAQRFLDEGYHALESGTRDILEQRHVLIPGPAWRPRHRRNRKM